MDEKQKTYSQLFDAGVQNGAIAEISEKVFGLLMALAAYADGSGVCYPPEKLLAKIIGVSERTIRNRITAAKQAVYRGVPVLAVRKNKVKERGKLIFANNVYTFSQPIREDLIGRYYSTGNKLPLKQNEETQGKAAVPSATFPSVKKLPHNDNQFLNKIVKNDKEKSPINKNNFGKIPFDGYKDKIKGIDDYQCWAIAGWLAESSMDFILAARADPQCRIAGIKWAYDRTKEDYEAGKVRDKRRYFNGLITKYKEGNNKK